jgi:hypothetical protein
VDNERCAPIIGVCRGPNDLTIWCSACAVCFQTPLTSADERSVPDPPRRAPGGRRRDLFTTGLGPVRAGTLYERLADS